MTYSPVTRIKKIYVYGVAGILIGLILGLVVGWGIWPVSWSDASAANLRPDMQHSVMSNAILAYTLTNDKEKALHVYQDFGAQAKKVLEAVKTNPGLLNDEQISRFASAVGDLSASTSLPAEKESSNPGGAVTNPFSKKNTGTIGLVLLGLLIAGAAAVYYFFFRGRDEKSSSTMSMVKKATPAAASQGAAKPTYAQGSPASFNQSSVPQRRIEVPAIVHQAAQAEKAAGKTELDATKEETGSGKAPVIPAGKPIAQFLTTYMYGDDLYDESFIFDAPNGSFLGECGVSFSDIVGTGEPKKISAFEIWLFDKNDVQTVTSVLMCQHAFDDLFMRENLEKKGDSVLAEGEKRFTMETASLVLEGHIVDLSYGELLQTPQSYFQRLTLELAVYQKD